MRSTEGPLTRERILAAAEEVVRRFGPGKATVVDVARSLGVVHASVYRHFASKAELREAVVARWLERSMPPLRAIAAKQTEPPRRLRRFVTAMISGKRQRATDDPELFAAFRTLGAESQTVVQAHVAELVALIASIIGDGVRDGSFRRVDPATVGRAVLMATGRFHHPAHAGEWADPRSDVDFAAVWTLVMAGLRAPRK